MRIDFHSGPQATSESERNQSQTASRADLTRQSDLVRGEDQAKFSGTRIPAQALAAQAAQLPEVREQKVQALREAIASGHYQPNPEQVAGALLSHMLAGPAA